MRWLFDLIRILERIFGKEMKSLDTRETPKWYQIALAELGVKEVSGTGNNPRILEYHSATSLKSRSDEVSWCSSFVNWCFRECGIKGTNSALARSWLDWGKEVKEPYKGCVVILSRGLAWQGHVGFFVEENGSMIGLLAGNQGDAVSIEYFPKSKILGFREPEVLNA
jgi:uncharacterized protein (TIGR02594 family)